MIPRIRLYILGHTGPFWSVEEKNTQTTSGIRLDFVNMANALK